MNPCPENRKPQLTDTGNHYTLALEVVKLILRDEYLRNLVLRHVVDTYREDLRKLLEITFAGVSSLKRL
ncbi:MAG: hypothetical protein QXZ56_04645 [Sulfolobales archaeon]